MSSQRRLEGRVALITGAGRGQGRAHALRLAQEGADVIVVDSCQDYESVKYPMATSDDLKETAHLVEQTGQRVILGEVDVRESDALTETVNSAADELGQLNIVCANAGICTVQPWDEVSDRVWRDTIDTNLTGVWNTIRASAPHLIAAGGGSIICTSSTGGIKGLPFLAPYVAAKHAVVGLARSMANELAAHSIRVNIVHPSAVETPMKDSAGDAIFTLIEGYPSLASIFSQGLPPDPIYPEDVSNAVAFLASDEARFITGLCLTIDAGSSIR